MPTVNSMDSTEPCPRVETYVDLSNVTGRPLSWTSAPIWSALDPEWIAEAAPLYPCVGLGAGRCADTEGYACYKKQLTMRLCLAAHSLLQLSLVLHGSSAPEAYKLDSIASATHV